MRRLSKLLLAPCLAISLCLTLFACSKINQSNFDKVKNGMTTQEVIAILGEPTSSQSVNIAGISGTSAVWKENDAEIDIQFLGDKVAVKAFNKSPDETPQKKMGTEGNP